MEFKKYKMAMRNRISPKNRDFVIDRERAPFDDNVSGLGEQPVFSQNEFTTTPMIDPAEFPARKEYMQSYAVGGNVRQLFGGGTLPKNVQEFLIETFPDLELKFNKGLPKYGLLTNNKNYNRVLQAANNKLKNPNYVFSPDFESLKYDKNFGTAKQLLEKARSKGIYVNEKTRTDIFARNFNIKSKPNPYSSNNPPHLIYDLSSLDDPKKTEQIIKKQIQSGSYTSETGEKYLSQEEQARKKRETSAKRTEAIKEYSVPSVERGYRGTKDVNLSHMDDIFNQYTTGYTLGYAPGKINKEFLTTYDNKIKALYEKRKKLNKQKPKGYLKELEKINEKGAKLAGETSGYKSFLFEDPYSQKTYQFGIDYSKTLDPTGILQGRRLQDVIDRERAPFDDNVSGLGEQPVFSQNEFTTTPMIDPAEFPARKEYMQSYATGGNVRQLYEEGGFVKITKEIEKELNSKNITPARRYQLKNTLQFINKLKKEASSVKGSKKIENLILKKDQLGRRFFSDYLEKLNALKDLQKGEYKDIKTGKVYSPEEWISLDATTRGKMRDPESFLGKKSKYQREYMSSKKKDPEFLEEFKLRKKEEYYSKERKKRQETKLSNNGRGVLLERRNNLLGYMSEAAKRGNPDFKEIIEDGKFLGVKDVANNINYYEAGYKGKLGKNSKLINSHPDYDNLKALNTLANKFKTETPNKAISSYFSAYERVPTYSEMYNFLQADPRFMKNISPRFFQTNALHKHHLISVTDSPTNKIMLLLQDKNDQAGKRMEEFKKGIITEDKLNKELKKLNARYVVNGKPLGAALTSPETQLKTAKTQTTKLFKQKLSENPNLVQEMTDRIGVQLLGTIGCSNTAQVSPRDKLTRVKNSIGGRIGFKEGSSCVEKGKKKIEEGKIGKSELNAVERSLEQSGKMTPDAKKYFTGAKVALKAGAKLPLELISVGFGPAGVVAGALLELATVQDDFMRGKNFRNSRRPKNEYRCFKKRDCI
jgi:hypothetical protein